MKKITIIALLCLAQGQVYCQTAASLYLFCYFKGNGDGLHYAWSNDGLTWNNLSQDKLFLEPAVSKDQLFRDPCITRGGDGNFHMVWTVSWNDKGIGYASSPDLVHWSEQQFLPLMQHEDSARNTWAPEINYISKKQGYIIYWASTISGRFTNKDTAAESNYNHRIYYTTTKDFKRFASVRLLYEPGFSVIDASIVQAGNRYIMFLKNETRYPVEKNIRIATANKVTGPYMPPGAPITGNYWAEGPTALQVNGSWVVYFDKYRDHKYGAVTSNDLKTWTDISDRISFPAGVRHGTALKISAGEFKQLQQQSR